MCVWLCVGKWAGLLRRLGQNERNVRSQQVRLGQNAYGNESVFLAHEPTPRVSIKAAFSSSSVCHIVNDVNERLTACKTLKPSLMVHIVRISCGENPSPKYIIHKTYCAYHVIFVIPLFSIAGASELVRLVVLSIWQYVRSCSYIVLWTIRHPTKKLPLG